MSAETEEKDFPFNSSVKLINPVIENYAIPNDRYVNAKIRVTADNIVLENKVNLAKTESNKLAISIVFHYDSPGM